MICVRHTNTVQYCILDIVVPVRNNAHGGSWPVLWDRNSVNMHGRMSWDFLGSASAILNSDGDDASVIASGVAGLRVESGA